MNKFEGFSLIFVLCFTNQEGNEINIRSDIILSFFSRFVFTQKLFCVLRETERQNNQRIRQSDRRHLCARSVTRRPVQMPIDWAILRIFRARLIDVDTCVICARKWRVSFVLQNFIVRVRFAFIESPDVRFRSIGFVLKRSTPHVLDHILAVCPNFRAFLARSSTGIYTTRVHVHS